MLTTRQRYTVPIHSETADKVLFGLTARQLLLLLIGCSLSYLCWLHLSFLGTWWSYGWLLRLSCALPPVLGCLLVAMIARAGRPLELWLLVWLTYRSSPKRYVWRSLKWEQSEQESHEEEEVADARVA